MRKEFQLKFKCPVCAYAMPYPPSDYNICPCCGTEFGADDVDWSYTELRARWMRRGAVWFSPTIPRPDTWNAYAQLIAGGYRSPTFNVTTTAEKESITPRLPQQNLTVTPNTRDVYAQLMVGGYYSPTFKVTSTAERESITPPLRQQNLIATLKAA